MFSTVHDCPRPFMIALLDAAHRLTPKSYADPSARRTLLAGVAQPLASRGLSLLEVFERPRPVPSQKLRKRPIDEQLAAGLASRAVVRLVFRVDDSLDGIAANGTGLPVAAVHGHALPKRRHL